MAKTTSIHIKLEDDLHARLVAMAKSHRRSINNMTEWLLHEHPLLKTPETKLNGHAHKTAATKTVPA
jgi:hypothetical protein